MRPPRAESSTLALLRTRASLPSGNRARVAAHAGIGTLVVAWMTATSVIFGAVTRTPATELVIGIISASLGAIGAAVGATWKGRGPRGVRGLPSRAVWVLLVFTLYACALGWAKWGGASLGDLARAASLGVFVLAGVNETAARFLRWCIRVTALYFTVLLIAYAAWGLSPPGYEPVLLGERLEGLHVVPATILLAAIAAELLEPRGSVCWWRVGAYLVAQSLEGHMSLMMSAVAILLFVTVMRFREARLRRSGASGIRAFGVLAGASAMVVGLLSYGGVLETLHRSDAWTSRVAISEKRIEEWRDHRWLGIGAPARDTELGRHYEKTAMSRFSETIRVADLGYLDIGIRYGVVLGSLYLAFWLYTAYVIARHARSWRTLTYPALVVAFLFANLSLSVFTFFDGLFCLLTVLTLSVHRIATEHSSASSAVLPMRTRRA